MASDHRYLDFLPPSTESSQARRGPSVAFQPVVVIMPVLRAPGRWRALWQIDDQSSHEEFYGSRSEALAWASERCNDLLVWSAEVQDLVPTTVRGTSRRIGQA
jgi:hypothetical protein